MWVVAISRLMEDAKSKGELKNDVNCRSLAEFWVTHWEGIFLLAAAMADPQTAKHSLEHMKTYFNQLKP